MNRNSDLSLETFIEDFREELTREISRRPKPSSSLSQLTVEVGLMAQSMLDIGDRVSHDWWGVWQGAKHVAALAALCALEGDLSLDAVPTDGNTK